MLPAGIFMTAAVVALTGLVLTISVSAISQSEDSGDDGPVARCDRVVGMVGQRLATDRTAADSAKDRRLREAAFRACLDDLARFQRPVQAR
jgi:hypothetical protein